MSRGGEPAEEQDGYRHWAGALESADAAELDRVRDLIPGDWLNDDR